MSGEIAPVLNRMAAFLLEQVQEDTVAGGKFLPSAMLLRQLADSIDDRASSCLAQAQLIRSIVNDASRLMPPTLAGELGAMVPPPPVVPEDFHARSLDAYLEQLKTALIATHTWLETCDAPESEEIIARIWDYLHAQAERESRLIPPMW